MRNKNRIKIHTEINREEMHPKRPNVEVVEKRISFAKILTIYI